MTNPPDLVGTLSSALDAYVVAQDAAKQVAEELSPVEEQTGQAPENEPPAGQ